jgi:quercetin dioxygenase-like cupin family protein
MADEPFHRTVLTNPSIKVFEIRLPVGARMKFHSHPTDHFAVVVRPGQLKNELIDGSLVINPPTEPGTVLFLPAGPAHRQTNVGDAEVHFIAGEIMRKHAGPFDAPKVDGCRNVMLDNERIVAYKCSLAPGETTESVRLSKPFLRVYISGGKVQDLSVKSKMAEKLPGTTEWFNSRRSADVRNAGGSAINFVEIVLK